MSSFHLRKMFSLDTFLTNLLDFTKLIIPLALIASESIAHSASGLMGYLVNKPLPATGISADSVCGCPKNEHLAEKQSFEGKCEILRTISQPRTLSADIPASREGVYLFYNPPIHFFCN